MTLGPIQRAIIAHIQSTPHRKSYAYAIAKAIKRSRAQVNTAIRGMIFEGVLEYADGGPPGENPDGSAARFGRATGPEPNWVRVREEWEGKLGEQIKSQE